MTTSAPPEGWFWGKLHVPRAGLRKLGYRYVDPSAGPSFRILCELGPPSAMAVAIEMARRTGFSMSDIVRLGGHETLRSHPSLPPEVLAFQSKSFESGGAVGTVVWELGAREREELGLPVEPPWAPIYRGEPPGGGALEPSAPRAAASHAAAAGTAAARGSSPVPRRPRAHAGHYVIGGFGLLLLLAAAAALASPPSSSFELTDEYPIVVLGLSGLGAVIVGWIVSSLWGVGPALLAMLCVMAPVLSVLGIRYGESLEMARAFRERVAHGEQLEGLCTGGGPVPGPVVPGTLRVFERASPTRMFVTNDAQAIGAVSEAQFPERVACVTSSEEELERATFDDPSSDYDATLYRMRVAVEVRVVRASDGAELARTVLRGSDPRPFAAWESGSLYGSSVDAETIRAFVASVP